MQFAHKTKQTKKTSEHNKNKNLKNPHSPDLHYFNNKSNIKKSSNSLATTILREVGEKNILNYPSEMKCKN